MGCGGVLHGTVMELTGCGRIVQGRLMTIFELMPIFARRSKCCGGAAWVTETKACGGRHDGSNHVWQRRLGRHGRSRASSRRATR